MGQNVGRVYTTKPRTIQLNQNAPKEVHKSIRIRIRSMTRSIFQDIITE